MLLTVNELIKDPPVTAWFCLRTQPKREHIAAAALRQMEGIDVFCPRLRFKKATARGAVWFVEAMFPGYLFARFDYVEAYLRVRAAQGVTAMLHFGDRIALLPNEVLQELRERSGEGEVTQIDQTIAPGQTIQIIEGPFQGLEAVVTRVIPARQRVQILLEFLGRTIEAEAEHRHILPSDNVRKRVL